MRIILEFLCQCSVCQNKEIECTDKSRWSEKEGKKKMLSLKLVRSLVLGENISNPLLLNQNHHYKDDEDGDNDDDDDILVQNRRSRRHGSSSNKAKDPLLLFLPTKEIVRDTYRLATIARDMGMDLYPNPSLSHIIFSWPSTSSPSLPSSWSSSSSSWSLSGDAIPLPFPSLATASGAQLRSFVRLTKGFFKLVFCRLTSNSSNNNNNDGDYTSNWDCCSLSLFSRLSGDRIDSMESFCRVLAGMGWTFFKTKNNPSLVPGDCGFNGINSAYLFRKVVANKVRAQQSNGNASASGEFRIRELRLPPLDFRNAPLRILQYIILMTDDLLYLA